MPFPVFFASLISSSLMGTMGSRRRVHLLGVAVGKKDHRRLRTCNLKRAWHPVINFPLAMKRLVGIVCCLFLVFASALWALEPCQSYNTHHDIHAQADENSSAPGLEFSHSHASTNDQTIHCPYPQIKLSFVTQPSSRITYPMTAGNVVPISFCSTVARGTGWMIHGEQRPPGSFLSAVSPYLSLSVLRI